MPYLHEIVTFLAGAIVGGGTVGFIMKVSFQKKQTQISGNNDSNRVSQKNIKAGGDVVGRDKSGN
jgi:hypothetical protein